MSVQAIVRALEGHRGIDQFIVVSVSGTRIGASTGGTKELRQERFRRVRVSAFRDVRKGRGTAEVEFDLDVDSGILQRWIHELSVRAARNVGPTWSLPNPAAPARVVVRDPVISVAPLEGARAAQAALRDLDGGVVSIVAQTVNARTSLGFSAEYERTEVRVRGRYRDGRIAQARGVGLDDLEWTSEPSAVVGEPVLGGAYTLFLGPAAVADGVRYGLFAPIVAQASGVWVHRGFARYRSGDSMGGRNRQTSQLHVVSDGAVHGSVYSRPFADDTSPTRRFKLVRAGRAAQVSATLREAALLGVSANGGVANLVVTAGNVPFSKLVSNAPNALFVHRWTVSTHDPHTGAWVADIAHAERPDGTLHSGGIVAGNIFELLHACRGSAERVVRGRYRGPKWLRMDGVTVR